MSHSPHTYANKIHNMIDEVFDTVCIKVSNELVKRKGTSSKLTRELCEDDSLSLRIQDISQCFCGLNSVIEKNYPSSMNPFIVQLKTQFLSSFSGVDNHVPKMTKQEQLTTDIYNKCKKVAGPKFNKPNSFQIRNSIAFVN